MREKQVVYVRAHSRLHFGLINPSKLTGETGWRLYGGVGLMVNAPGVELSVEANKSWLGEGPAAPRAVEFARLFAASVGAADLPPHRIVVHRCAPFHVGLGSGTQLALSVARALERSWQLPPMSACQLARRVGRGKRSAVGIHGFEHGGFLVDGGKASAERLGPLVARCEFPQPWRVLLVTAGRTGLHGAGEAEAMARLHDEPQMPMRVNALCRLVLTGMLPALAEQDIRQFGEALFEFNRLVGESFAPVQGAIYSTPKVAETIRFLREQKIAGVAQSSWGPTVAAIVEDADRADYVRKSLQKRLGLSASDMVVTAAANHGAVVT
ncbi:MAG: beta-ribofuranosylaminobenzene 5'-phosphate synthase [Gemmatales bacterium]|nr:MAG: beta-ribofuranosylaminobenzene 5'-phosphate synthase [Gemmatales bacterium]